MSLYLCNYDNLKKVIHNNKKLLNKKWIFFDIDYKIILEIQNNYLKIENKIGIRDYYLNKKDIHDIINGTEINNLYFIPAGLISPNPSEIISSDKMKDLIKKVKNSFDIIIIDSPPVTAALEVAALGSYVDGISMVVKSNSSSATLVKKVINDLKSFKYWWRSLPL